MIGRMATVYARSEDVEVVEDVVKSPPLMVLVGLVLGAGVIHAFAAGEHVTESMPASVAFALVAVGQLVAAARMYRSPDDRRTLLAAATGSTAVAAGWVLSRTVGLPFADGGAPQPVGVADSVATLEEIALAVLVWALLRRPRQAGRPTWLTSPLTLRIASAVLSSALFVAVLIGHDTCFLGPPTGG